MSMKILVREQSKIKGEDGQRHNICTYVWKKVTDTNPFRNGWYSTTDGVSYRMTDIIKVTGDYRLARNKYIICKNCGKVIRESELLQHYAEVEGKVNCANCEWLKLVDIKGESAKRTVNPDGTVIEKQKYKGTCTEGRSSYYSGSFESIATIDKVAKCKFFKCRREGAEEIGHDFLCDHPNYYSVMLTENAAIDGGWKYVTTNYLGRQYSNKEGRVIAQFDTNGILMHFQLLYKGDSNIFCYSDKYDIFFSNGGEFRWNVNWNNVSEQARERYKKQIRALYHIGEKKSAKKSKKSKKSGAKAANS